MVIVFSYLLKLNFKYYGALNVKTKLIDTAIIVALVFSLQGNGEETAKKGREATKDADEYICAVFFHGEGCEHCAKIGSLMMEDLFKEYPNLVFTSY